MSEFENIDRVREGNHLSKIISFNSHHNFFVKEFCGIKPNTVRIFNAEDARHMRAVSRTHWGASDEIEIVCVCGCDKFIAPITDVSLFNNDKILIISFQRNIQNLHQ